MLSEFKYGVSVEVLFEGSDWMGLMTLMIIALLFPFLPPPYCPLI
jgi:hypothetical protein